MRSDINAAAKRISECVGLPLGKRQDCASTSAHVKVRWPLGVDGEIVLTIEDGYTCAGDVWAADVRVEANGGTHCKTLVRPMSTNGVEVKREGRAAFCRYAERFIPAMLSKQ